MRRSIKTASLILAGAFAAGLLAASSAKAQVLTFVSFGGGYQDAQRKAVVKPFTEETGVIVNEASYGGELGKIKAMVASGNVEWDVVDVEGGDAGVLCEEGLVEVIPDAFWERAGGKEAFHPAAVQECAAGAIFWSTVFAYDANRIPPEKAAKTWADFWNVEKFPGPRCMRRSPRSNLEFALLADGVPPEEIYDVLRTPEGVDRAFRKLDEIKPYVKVWWDAGAQPPQLLADGEVAYATAYNGRIYDANVHEDQNLKIVWAGHNYTLDLYVIPKGSPNKDLALKFIAFSLRPDRQAAMTDHISYGPVANAAIPLINPKVLPHLPNAPEHMEEALLVDEDFWVVFREPLTERFEAWLAQ